MTQPPTPDRDAKPNVPVVRLLIAWIIVGVPLAWGVAQTLLKALPLFTGGEAP
ncbi:oxalate:formate antiporter [Deinococcus sp. YIM 77859]|uniref:MFS transporter small subunit n=1 Tax=Deinococcus sp. YIM 77859 TaxID=1540221 RepID=UPI000B09FEE4|nr:oxalate:formate antiporter [Deinococcus sp. YIM 77859]